MTAEQANTLIDGVARGQARAARFRSAISRIFEVLYGCGLARQRVGRAEPR